MGIRFSLRAAVSGMTDAFGRFLVVNIAWMLVGALTVAAGRVFPPGYLLGLALVPVSCGLMRMATHAARKDFPQLRHFRDGFRGRVWAHLGLGGALVLVLVTAFVNLAVGLRGGTLLFALVAVTAAYAALATLMFAVAAWPLLLDPKRAGLAVPTVLRLALAVVFSRPGRLLALTVIELVLLGTVTRVVLLGLLVPSFGALVAAHFVLPVADGLVSSDHRSSAP